MGPHAVLGGRKAPQPSWQISDELCPASRELSPRGPAPARNMTNDPMYVLMFEDLTVADDGDVAMESDSSDGTSDDEATSSALQEAQAEKPAEVTSQPEFVARRAELVEVTNTTVQPSKSQSSEVPPPSEAVTSATARGLKCGCAS